MVDQHLKQIEDMKKAFEEQQNVQIKENVFVNL